MKNRYLQCFLVLVFAMLIVAVSAAIKPEEKQKAKSVRLIITTDTQGYIEPCGCGGRKLGGLARRVTITNKLAQENPNTIIVDTGNLTPTADKLDVITSVMSKLNYACTAMGDADFRNEEEFLKQTAEKKIPVLNALPNAPKGTLPYMVKKIGEVKIGIISFGAPKSTGVEDATVDSERRRSLFGAYKIAREKSDILVVLDPMGTVNEEWIDRNASRLGTPDVVVGGAQRVVLQEPKIVGKTHFLPTYPQVKYFSTLDICITPKSDPQITISKIEINTDTAEDPDVLKQVLAVESKGKLSATAVAVPASDIRLKTSNKAQSYYASTMCRVCHSSQYDQWSTTKHAKAVQTLRDADRLLPECLTCHSESFKKTQSIDTMPNSPGGVECVSCHIKGVPHGIEHAKDEKKNPVDPAVCKTCHTREYSANYDEKTYMPRIVHNQEAATKGK